MKTDKGYTFVKNPDTVLSAIQIGLGSKATIIDPDRLAYRPAWYHVTFD